MEELYKFLELFSTLFFEMSFYLLFGLAFVGVLYVWFTKELITKHIGKDSLGSIIKAAILGVPLPLCSCGVVPTTVYMSKNGASQGAVVSFLVSTPQTGIDSIIATYGMMGPIFAIFRPVSALLMGVISGAVVQFLPHKSKATSIPHNTNISSSNCSASDCSCSPAVIQDDCSGSDCCSTSQPKTQNKFIKALHYSFVEFLDDISPQFVLGLFIATLITYFIPTDYFAGSQFSSGILGMLIMIAIGIPMYICATASIPIAISLMLKGFSPGVAFVFLATGPATNAATLSILIKTLGKRIVSLYLVSLVITSIAFGYLLDFIFSISNINPLDSFVMSDNCHSEGMSIWEIAFGTIFLMLLLMSLYRIYLKKYFIKSKKEPIIMDKAIKLKVEGMNCNHCSNNVHKAIESFPQISNIKVDLSSGIATFDGDINPELVIEKIKEFGYDASLL